MAFFQRLQSGDVPFLLLQLREPCDIWVIQPGVSDISKIENGLRELDLSWEYFRRPQRLNWLFVFFGGGVRCDFKLPYRNVGNSHSEMTHDIGKLCGIFRCVFQLRAVFPSIEATFYVLGCFAVGSFICWCELWSGFYGLAIAVLDVLDLFYRGNDVKEFSTMDHAVWFLYQFGHFGAFFTSNLQYSDEKQHVPENQWLEDVLPTEIVPF